MVTTGRTVRLPHGCLGVTRWPGRLDCVGCSRRGVARVLSEFLSDLDRPRYGYDLIEATGYPSGKIYPILGRLTDAGWLIRQREDIDPAAAGRPARFTYRLSQEAAVAARRELGMIAVQLSPQPVMRSRRVQAR